LTTVQEFFIYPGLPLGAALLSEMALRDGITNRTLLYPLLGPASRRTLALSRTLVSAALLFTGLLVLYLAVGILAGTAGPHLGDRILALLLGALAYTCLSGLIHLVSARGLVACLVLYGTLDYSIGRLPFAVAQIAPAHHVRVLADLEEVFSIPVGRGAFEPSAVSSAILLVLFGLVSLAVTAVLFQRKSLAELC
jgi:ABC-type transport system involved in multi-copper enzyme maturation permease subunit